MKRFFYSTLPLQTRIACILLSLTLTLSTLHLGFFRTASARNQGSTQGTLLPLDYELPAFNSLDKLKKSDEVAQPPLKPSTSCGYRDKACKVKKEKEKKVGSITPMNDYQNSRIATSQEKKGSKHWLTRIKNSLGATLSSSSFLYSATLLPTNFSDEKQNLMNESKPVVPNRLAMSATATAAAFTPPSFGTLEQAKTDPHNRIGKPEEDLFSGNYNYILPLVSLPGRGGLNLNIILSYNSLIWIRYQNRMAFDPDYYPTLSPGFRTGFPELEGPYYFNNAYHYIAQMPTGERVLLKQVAADAYEAIDSSYLYLKISTTDPNKRTLYTTDGTQYKFEVPAAGVTAGVYWSRCTEIKDRNGNYISIAYKTIGDPTYPLLVIDKVIDTVGRQIVFEYDPNLHLQKITQNRNGTTFIWAQFDYADKAIDPNFPTQGTGSVLVEGPDNGELGPMVTRVITGDGARHAFVYNTWGQVDDHWLYGEDDQQRMGTDYTFPTTSLTDCPRFTQRRNFITQWGDDGSTPAGWATTTFAFDPDEAFGKYTNPEGVTYKEYFYNSLTDGKRGLPYRSELCTKSGQIDVIQQFTEYTWASDSASGLPLRPRVTDICVYDDRNHNGTYESAAGGDKKKRTAIGYVNIGNNIKLPSSFTEYEEGGLTPLRVKEITYEQSANYTGSTRRIIGLPRTICVLNGSGTLAAKTEYIYDTASDAGMSYLQQHTPASQDARQHDKTGYGSGFTYRGNLIKTLTYSVDSGVASNPIEQRTEYFITGNPAGTAQLREGQLLKTQYFYDDASSVGIPAYSPSLSTFAYLTKTIEPNDSPGAPTAPATLKYDYWMGAVTEIVDPKSNQASIMAPPAKQLLVYDSKDRLLRIEMHKKNSSNAVVKYSQKRFLYYASQNMVTEYNTVNDVAVETWTHHYLDGASRERITISDFPSNPGSPTASNPNPPSAMGHMKSAYVVYDVMGRISVSSRPTQIGTDYYPTGMDTVYVTSSQTYDWKGRPLVTTNADSSTVTLSYDGCGCSGVNQVTRIDEVGRKEVSSYDVFGRMIQTDSYKANGTPGGVVCLTETYQYDTRDLMTERKAIDAAPMAGGPPRSWPTIYDGYGRVWKSKAPEEEAYTEFLYNTDNTVKSKTDPRGVATNYKYYNRSLVKEVTYTLPSSPTPPILPSNALLFEYDENGNRKKMTEKVDPAPGTPIWAETVYQYDELSRLSQEDKSFTGIPGIFSLSYTYNLANQTKRVDFASSSRSQDNFFFEHQYDNTGSITGVIGSNLFGYTSYLGGIQYSAWGAFKTVRYGPNGGHGGLETYNYTAEMEVLSYSVTAPGYSAGSVQPVQERMKAIYGYYPDGKLKTVESGEGSTFDRGYTYDDLGRLKDSFTSTPATAFRVNGTLPSPPNTTTPYYQSFQYNAWGQISQRTGKVWSKDDISTLQYTAEGRRLDLSHDKAGNVTNDGVNKYEYDAAGNSARVKPDISNDTSRGWYDGDGRLVCSNPYPEKKEIWIRSTVLNGAVIAAIQGRTPGDTPSPYYQYAPLGAAVEQNIFIGERVVGQQAYAYLNVNGTNRTHTFIWRHHKPLIGTEFKVTSTLGEAFLRSEKVAERNAEGVNVGMVEPTAPPPPTSPDYETLGLTGSPNNERQVLLDGLPIEFSLVRSLLRVGAAEIDWRNLDTLALIQEGVFGHLEAKYEYDGKERIRVGEQFVVDFFGEDPQGKTKKSKKERKEEKYPPDPCAGKDGTHLDYNTTRTYKDGNTETGKDHIIRNHTVVGNAPLLRRPITSPPRLVAYAIAFKKSLYGTNQSLNSSELFDSIRNANSLTFAFGTRTDRKDATGNLQAIIFSYNFPPSPRENGKLSLNLTGAEYKGAGVALPTNANTVILDPDCTVVQTSFPGSLP